MLVTVMFLKPCVYMGKHLMHIFVNLNYKMGNFDRQVGTFIYRTCVSLKLRLGLAEDGGCQRGLVLMRDSEVRSPRSGPRGSSVSRRCS